MTFWELFFRVLPHKPKQALTAAFWHLARRRVRSRNRLRVASGDLPFAYAVWISNNERANELSQRAVQSIQEWNWRPRFAIMLHGDASSPELLDQSIESIRNQIYPSWHLLDGSFEALRNGIEADADYLVPLCIGDQLSPTALYRMAEAAQQHRDCSILYGDQDELDELGQRCNPWFKPGWNREMFLAQDYLTSAMAITARLAGEAAQRSVDLAGLTLEATWTDPPIVHVPHVLCHVARRSENQHARIRLLKQKLRSLEGNASAGSFNTIRIEWPLPRQLPLVSIIVPTKDRLELLRPCIESVLGRTTYEPFEILIVDNASVERRTKEYLAHLENNSKVRILDYPDAYNFSAINNFAARAARGTYICMLNNDTEVVNADWLSELMRYATRKEIGAVGAKLLYEDGTIQHAGVVVGIGEAAGHAHRFLPADQPGYFRQAHVAHYVSAVTAACLVVEKIKFETVGGLDEAQLAVAFNDVDLCLKLQREGWRNVYVPHAILLHHESKSRGKDTAPVNIDRYRRELEVLQQRWGTKDYNDPVHNPNLDRYSETFIFSL